MRGSCGLIIQGEAVACLCSLLTHVLLHHKLMIVLTVGGQRYDSHLIVVFFSIQNSIVIVPGFASFQLGKIPNDSESHYT